MNGNRTSPTGAAERLAAFGAVLPKRGSVLIFPHDYPDPDALASAGALHLLLEKHFKLHAHIVFSGVVARAENRVLLRHFRYRWHLLPDYPPPRSGLVPAVFADTRPWSANTTCPSFAKPVAVFDHHPLHGRRIPAGLFMDLRPRLGATASMLYEYLQAADLPIPPWLASALVYAISTETMDFTRSFEPLDLQAYVRLISRANQRMLGEIRNAPLPQKYFIRMKEAIERARVYGRVAWSHLPSVDQPEFVAEIADRLVQIERITWSFCTAFHGDRLIISLRSNRRDAACDVILRRAMPRGGEAGGHDRMAAGALPVSHMTADQRQAALHQIERRLLNRIERRAARSGESPEEVSRLLAGSGRETNETAAPAAGPATEGREPGDRPGSRSLR